MTIGCIENRNVSKFTSNVLWRAGKRAICQPISDLLVTVTSDVFIFPLECVNGMTGNALARSLLWRKAIVCGRFPLAIYACDIYMYLLWEYRIQHGANGPLYVTSSYSTWIFCRGVSGFATDCPCGVWCRGLTTCLLHAGPPFGNQILNNSWAVGLT